MSASVESARNRKDWQDALTEVEQTLQAALAEVSLREQALQQFAQVQRTQSKPPTWPRALEQCIEQKQQLRELAELAEEKVSEVEAALVEGEEELRQWLAKTKAARENLQSWMQTSIGTRLDGA